MSETGLSARSINDDNGLRATEDTPMLFIFNNKNSIQIAWGGKLAARKPQSRLSELDTRFGTIGLIRTFNAG
jgi:hypothetical protein